jgi:uncharacterized protein with beta-barrel porin domain
VRLRTEDFTEEGGDATLSGTEEGTDATFTSLGLRASTAFALLDRQPKSTRGRSHY